MYEIGELVRWRCPLDADYSYGYVAGIRRNLEGWKVLASKEIL